MLVPFLDIYKCARISAEMHLLQEEISAIIPGAVNDCYIYYLVDSNANSAPSYPCAIAASGSTLWR